MGVGRTDGKVLFVPHTAPGDTVEVDVVSEKRGFAEGRIRKVIIPSSLRQHSSCVYVERCGGCHWQHIRYEEQVDWKERIFLETLKRIGGIDDIVIEPCIASPSPLGYRTRAQFHVKSGTWGFFEAGSNDIVEIEECPVLHPVLNKAFQALRDFIETEYRRCAIHTVEIGLSEVDRKAVALIHSSEEMVLGRGGMVGKIPCIKGVRIRRSSSRRDRAWKETYSEGDTGLAYILQGLNMRVDIAMFSQINTVQNSRLVEAAIAFCNPTRGDYVTDLFCGGGNITLPLSMRCKEVTGIDVDRLTIEKAGFNAERNTIRNVRFIRANLFKGLKSIDIGKPPTILLDPPRGGGMGVLKEVASLKPGRIVYVSCNPSTLGRDISILKRYGYNAGRARIIDMFPQTYHIEGIVELLYSGGRQQSRCSG